MKILHLIDSGGLYGAEKMLLSLVEQQLRQGLAPLLLSAGEPGIDEKAIEKEAKIRGLPFLPWRMKAGFNLSEGLGILRWAREQNIEILHSHGYKFNILLGIIPRRWRRIPMVTTIHGYVHAPRFSKMWLYEILDRYAIRSMNRVVLVSQAMEDEFRDGFSRRKMHIIPNGIDVEATLQQAEVEPASYLNEFLAQHHPVILGVGRLSPEKSFETLIAAFAEILYSFPRSGLLIVGEGPAHQSLSDLALEYGLGDSFMLPGFVDNTSSLMAESDVLVMPSRTEGTPMTALEAMALALPIIASRVGGLPELLEHGNAGILLDELVPRNLTNVVMENLRFPQKMKEKATNAKYAVKNKFSNKTMSDSYIQLYRELIN